MSTKPKLAVVETIHSINPRSITDQLRHLADVIDQEAEGDDAPSEAVVAIQLMQGGRINLYGWGDVDDLKALGMMERGKFSLLATLDGDTQ